MSVLSRKLVRDLARSKWQYIAIGAMVALGVSFFNASYAAYLNLLLSYENSYDRLAFEHFGITFNSAPERVIERVRRVEGISAVEGRLVEDVILELPEAPGHKKLIGRFISIPIGRRLTVDQLKLVAGRMPRLSMDREVLLEASFAKHHDMKPGARVEAVRGNSRVKLRVSGIVQSDEYLYVVRSKHELMAMPDTFGVMFVSRDVLGSLVGRRGQINEFRLRIAPDAKLDRVMLRVSDALKAYKPEQPVPRMDQPSYQMLMQDVQGFQMYAILFPAFFLSVALLAVYSLLLRMVHQQRPVIGLLKSLGFSSGHVIRHFVAIAAVVGIASSLVGSVLGVILAQWASAGYMSQLQVPYMQIVPRPAVIAWGILIGVSTCIIGGLFPARVAARIKPAEAMRPAPPASAGRSIALDRLFPNTPLIWRIPMRNVFREPKRTLSTLFGVVSGIALMMTAKGLLDSSTDAIDDLVTGSYRYDLRVDFIRHQSRSVVSRVASWPGVVRAEGILEVPVEMRHGGQTYSAMASGQPASSLLHRLTDESGSPVRLRGDGGIFGATLRKRLGLEVGDTVDLSLPEELTKERSTHRIVKVAGFNSEAIGTVAYFDQGRLAQLFRKDLELPPNPIGSIVLKVEPKYRNEVRERLAALGDAGSVLSVPEIRALIEGMLGTIRGFVWIMELFGAALAFAMVFNMVSINVLERSMEVATLRTIGVSRRRISWMIMLENLAVSLIGIAIGLPIGRWFIQQFWKAAQTPEQEDLFTFRVVLYPETYASAALGVLLVAIVSQIPSLRAINRLDLAQATKERST